MKTKLSTQEQKLCIRERERRAKEKRVKERKFSTREETKLIKHRRMWRV